MFPRSDFRRVTLVSFLLGAAAGTFFTAGAAAGLLGSAVFPDVAPGAFYDEAVGELNAAGIIRGYEDGKYHPDDYLTRGQLAVLFQRLRDDLNGIPLAQDIPASASSSSSSSIAASSPAAASLLPVGNVSSTSRSRRSFSKSSSSSSSSSSVDPAAGSFRFTASLFSIPDVAPAMSISIVRSDAKKEAAVGYELGGGTAMAGTDYTPTKGVLAFAKGELSRVITSRIIRNPAATGNRTVNLTLTNPTNGAGLGSPATTVITLVKAVSSGAGSSSSSVGAAATTSGPGGIFAYSAIGFGVMENGGNATVTVIRTGTTANAATVEYTTLNEGTAVEGTHFTKTTGTLSFAANETSKTFTVPVNNNTAVDGNAILYVQLKNPSSGAGLGYPSKAALAIIDDEAAPTAGSGTLKMESSRFSAKNSDGTAYVTVLRTAGVTGTAAVQYETIDDSAKNGTDYTRVSGTITFAPGEMKKVVAIPLLAHAGYEGEKDFTFRITNPSGNAQLGVLTDASVVVEG